LLIKGKNSEVDYFKNESMFLFNKVSTIELSSIATIRRGLEIGKDKMTGEKDIVCLNGSAINKYIIKYFNYISKNTLDIFKKNIDIFSSPKLVVRETGNTFYATFENENAITNRSLYNVRFTNNLYNPKFVLSLINSKLFEFYFKQVIAPDTNIFPKIRIVQLNKIPIPQLPAPKTQNRLVSLVDSMLETQKQYHAATMEADKKLFKQKIDILDHQIDSLVYQLYGLTEEEIKTVEGK